MIIRFCIKSLPAIGYRRLIADQFEPRNVVWFQNTFACCFRGFFCRFKSTRSGLFKSLTDTVRNGNAKKPEEDIKITDAKSSKLEEGKTSNTIKNNPQKTQADRLYLNKIKPMTIDPGIAAPKIKINEKIAVKNVQPEPEVLRELSDKVQKIKMNEIKKSDDPFSQFQQLLTIPQYRLDQKLNTKSRESSTKKKSSPKSLSKGKFIPRQLAKNKTDPKLYENLTLLKDPEPQCEFLELQSGKRRIHIGGLSESNLTNSKSNFTNSRTITSQAENRPPQKPTLKKKSIIPAERLERKLVLETPKIKAIKNRMSKMDRYWEIAANKNMSEPKIPNNLLRLKDRICQQIEASKNFKYETEQTRLAAIGNEEVTEDKNFENFAKSSAVAAVDSSSNVLERIKTVNRKLKTEPYIPPITKKKSLGKKPSAGKLILRKIKKEKKVMKTWDDANKSDVAPIEPREKIYSDKIRKKIMEFTEKWKRDIQKAEVLAGQTQEEEGPDAHYIPSENQSNSILPEIEPGTPVEIPPLAPEVKPEEPVKVPEEPKKPSKLPDEPKKPKYLAAENERFDVPSPIPRPPKIQRPALNFSTTNFPKQNFWNVKPPPQAKSPEENTNIRKFEPRPSMSLQSAMEGFKMNSDVSRIILQAKARAMGVGSEELKAAQKEAKQGQKKKRPETIRKSTFFTRKKKSKNTTKENILSVDKPDGAEIQEVTKRSRVPIKIPENVPESSADRKIPPPTQEEVAKKIRQWYTHDSPGMDPKASTEKENIVIPTLEKAHQKATVWPVERKNEKEEKKVEGPKAEAPSPAQKIQDIVQDIVQDDGNAYKDKKEETKVEGPRTEAPLPTPKIRDIVKDDKNMHRNKKEETKVKKLKKETEDLPPASKIQDVIKDEVNEHENKKKETNVEEPQLELPPRRYRKPEPKTDDIIKAEGNAESALVTPDPDQDISPIVEPHKPQEIAEPVSSPDGNAFVLEETPLDSSSAWVSSDPIFQKKVEEEMKTAKSEVSSQAIKKTKSDFKKRPEKITAHKPKFTEFRKSESSIKKEKKEAKKYDTRVGSTIKKESMLVSEKPVMLIKKTEKAQKPQKAMESRKDQLKVDPDFVPKMEKQPKSAALKVDKQLKVEDSLSNLEEPPELKKPKKRKEPLKLKQRPQWGSQRRGEVKEVPKVEKPNMEDSRELKRWPLWEELREAPKSADSLTLEPPKQRNPSKVMKLEEPPELEKPRKMRESRELKQRPLWEKLKEAPETEIPASLEPSKPKKANKWEESQKMEDCVKLKGSPQRQELKEVPKLEDSQKFEEPLKLEEPQKMDDCSQLKQSTQWEELKEAPKQENSSMFQEPLKLEEPQKMVDRLQLKQSSQWEERDEVPKVEEIPVIELPEPKHPPALKELPKMEEFSKSKQCSQWKELKEDHTDKEPRRKLSEPEKEPKLKLSKAKKALKAEDRSKFEKPFTLEQPQKMEEFSKSEQFAEWEEPVKPEWSLQSAPIDPPTILRAEFDEISSNTIPAITSQASKMEENRQHKGAINIQLKPLSEIENLTKGVKGFEKRKLEDRPRIDVFEELISKKIETIPCAKPKLPPYYYTPYSSSTVEPEELPNKKEDKADEK